MVSGANKVCIVMGPKTFKALPTEGAHLLLSTLLLVKKRQWTHGSTSTLPFIIIFTFIPRVLISCTSSEWGRVRAGYGRNGLHLCRRVQNIVPKLLAVAEKILSSKIHVFLIWFQAERLLFQSNNMPWRYRDCLEKVKGCAFGQVSNEFHVSVTKELSIFTSKMSLTD